MDESGNYDHWKYSVQYTEHLSHLPMIRNTAHGHFSVKPKSQGYIIESKHRTCFFLGMGCRELLSYEYLRYPPACTYVWRM